MEVIKVVDLDKELERLHLIVTSKEPGIWREHKEAAMKLIIQLHEKLVPPIIYYPPTSGASRDL